MLSSFCLWLAGAQSVAFGLLGLLSLVRPTAPVRWMRRLSLGLAASGATTALIAIAALLLGSLPHDASGLRLDVPGAVLLALILTVGSAVIVFSRNYLDGDPRQGVFLGDLALTIAAASLLVISGTLWLFWLAWVGMSLSLHRLLMFYGDRPAARLAARKKFLWARLSDLCLLVAFILISHAFATTDIGRILVMARGAAATPELNLAVAAMIAAAVLKSAQFPAHGWLLEVMETPTPVSALLHAGVVNAGGVLLLRLSEVVVLNPAAMAVLVLVSLASVAFGALAMTTQTSAKLALACSTVGQMGFMLLQCGLGAFCAALFHIVAHGVYKAHAFMTAGTVRMRERAPAPAPVLRIVLIAIAGIAGAAWCLRDGNVTVILAAMAVVSLLSLNARAWPMVLPLAGAAWVSMQTAWHALMPGPAHAPVSPYIGATAILIFAGTCALSVWLRAAPASPLAAQLYVHLRNGVYVNTWLNRHLLKG